MATGRADLPAALGQGWLLAGLTHPWEHTMRIRALVATSVAALSVAASVVTAPPASAARSSVLDPVDVPYAGGDIERVIGGLYDSGASFAIRVRDFESPFGNKWVSGESAVLFLADVDGDGAEDFDIEYYNNGNRRLVADVYDSASGSKLCSVDGTSNRPRRELSVFVPASCIGSRSSLAVAAVFAYTKGTGGVPTTFDVAPDDGFAPASTVTSTSFPGTRGYWTVGRDGGVFSYGSAPFHGSTGGMALNQPIVGMAGNPRGGYWFVAADGGIFSYGGVQFHGSTGDVRLNQPIIAMASTPDGGGYYLLAADGGIFCFGNAQFFGSTGAVKLNQPVVGMAVHPSGNGYWLVAADGGIFSFGPAAGFHGSTGGIPLNQPIVGMTASKTGGGYRFVAADGGVFAFGDAPFYGSGVSSGFLAPVVGMASSPTGDGYHLVTAGGEVDAYGDASYGGQYGADVPLIAPMVGIATSY